MSTCCSCCALFSNNCLYPLPGFSRELLNGVERSALLSGRWLGLTRPSIALGQKTLEPDPTAPDEDWNRARCAEVNAKYRQICKVMPTRSVLDLIRKPTIDMWQWEDYEVSNSAG